MTITALPEAPSTSDPTNFAAKADALLAALATFVTEANALAVAMNLNSTTDSSATSNSIATGAKTFTVTAGKSFQPGMFLVIADTAAPSTNWMYGQVTSYGGTALVMSITVIGGSGTKTAWTISQSAAYNIAGSSTQDFAVKILTAAGAISGTTLSGSAAGMPKFSVNRGTVQTVTSNVATQAQFGTEEFDTNTNFATHRFTPTVVGYYQINWLLDMGGDTNTLTSAESHLRKNGAMYASGGKLLCSASHTQFASSGSVLVYMNGSTDYLEVWGTAVGTNTAFNYSGTSSHQRFNGALLV